jgi:hypothetical protein
MTVPASSALSPEPQDSEAPAFSQKVEALRRLSPVKVRLLGLIAEEMLREARQVNTDGGLR